MTMTTFCTFHLHDLYIGVEVTNVQEVLRTQEMTRVPLAPKVVKGLINLRGQIVTALDLRARLSLPQRGEDQEPMNVIVSTADGPVSFLVDAIGDVIEVDENSVERPPMTMDATARGLLRGVCKLNQQLMLILDPEKTADLTQ